MNQIPNGFDLLNFLTPTPHQPSGYHYQSPQVYHHHVCCWQLSLAWFLLEEKSWIYGSWDVGKKNLHRDNIWVFVGELGNSNPPIKSASIRFPSSQRSREGGFGFQRLFLLLGYGSKYSPPNGWMIGKHDP